MVEFSGPGCCEPIVKQIKFAEKFVEPPQILITTRALEYDVGPVSFFCSIMDVTEQGFTLQLTVTKNTLKLLTYDYVAINQDEVEFGYFNFDALSVLKDEADGDKQIPTFLKFKRSFAEDPIVQIYIIGFESLTQLIQFEILPQAVSIHGLSILLKKFGPTSISKVQLSYVATEPNKKLAQLVTHTGQSKASIEKAQPQEFLQMEQKPKLVQINGLNGLRFLQGPVAFMWQGDQIDPTALNVNLRITLDKGNQIVLGLFYLEDKEFKKCPIVYSLCSYQGTKTYLCRDVPNFQKIMKVARSIFIPDKTSITVFQDIQYAGSKTKLSKSIECIQDWFLDVPETQVKDIKAFLQINQMKRHKDKQIEEITQGVHEVDNKIQMPFWEEMEQTQDDYEQNELTHQKKYDIYNDKVLQKLRFDAYQ
ncbi:hypothetical protein pb186bvf_006744 [Paramecium bursaria]